MVGILVLNIAACQTIRENPEAARRVAVEIASLAGTMFVDFAAGETPVSIPLAIAQSFAKLAGADYGDKAVEGQPAETLLYPESGYVLVVRGGLIEQAFKVE